MGYAKRHPEPEKRGRGNKSAGSGEFSGVPHQRVAEARIVNRYAGDLADGVLAGNPSLDVAYKVAR